MKNHLFTAAIAAALAVICSGSAIAADALAPVPLPVKMVQDSTANPFVMTGSTKISAEAPEAKFAAQQLSGWVKLLKLSRDGADKNLVVFTKSEVDLGPEGYTLKVLPEKTVICASAPGGFLYGAQTLRQLLPTTAKDVKDGKVRLGALEIQDSPRFAWRGLMLDCCRHYFEFNELKKIVDVMASLKLNTLHWHLTEDHAWRLEIKKYPELTARGAWRPSVGFDLPTTSTKHYRKSDGMYGGFYTQEQARELVKYAAERNITIVPEFEIPGHAMAFLHVFPQYGCTGKPIPIAMTGGVFPDIMCAGNEDAMKVCEDILTEVAEIFPGTYIHIGGDEAPKTNWKACPKCQERMKQVGAKNENQLQNWVTVRMEKKLNSLGKKLIGWDEILEGDNLSSTAAVQVWRPSFNGAELASAGGHEMVMSPTSHCYLDYAQSKNTTEPRSIGGYISLEKVYSFEPENPSIPADKRHLVKGGQGNLWTEYIPNESHLEYMIAPRAAAMAEVLWSPKEKRDWADFRKRLETQVKRFDAMKFRYRPLDPVEFRDPTLKKQ